jgi:hypothetical protein
MSNSPRIDLRRGVVEPVILLISRRQVEEGDVASVIDGLKVFTATREDTWRYRGQMSLLVDGYNEDARELVDIAQVRDFLCALEQQWPYWAFFLNQVDDSIKLLGSCVCGVSFPGAGAVEIDLQRLRKLLRRGFDGLNALFDRYGFEEQERELMSLGLAEVLGIEE